MTFSRCAYGVVFFIGLCARVTAGADQHIYWTALGSVARSAPDGSNVEKLPIPGLVAPLGIALDRLSGKLYCTDPSADVIFRANLDGSGREDLVSGVNAYEIALDIGAGKMYWTEFAPPRIRRANIDGSLVQDLVTNGLTSPRGIALDLRSGKLYCADHLPQVILRANLDGSGVENVLITNFRPVSMAIDFDGGTMYWTSTDQFGKSSCIQRAALSGSNGETLVSWNQVGDFPFGVALDLGWGLMYWAQSTQTDGRIRQASLDGAPVEDVVPTLTKPRGVALDWTPLGVPVPAMSIVGVSLMGFILLGVSVFLIRRGLRGTVSVYRPHQ